MPRTPPFVFLILLGVTLSCGAVRPLAGQSSGIKVRVTAVDPDTGGVMPLNRAFYLRVHYECAKPIRLTAKGLANGKVVEDTTNPSPVYPAGIGEGMVWISFHQPTQLDEVQITAADELWRPLLLVSMSAAVSWKANVSNPPEAPWVMEMNAAQQKTISASMNKTEDGFDLFGWVFFALLYGSVLAWPVLQIMAWYRDGWKSAASGPMLAMGPLLVYTAFAYYKESNLWPLLLLFASPLAVIYFFGLMIYHRMARRPEG